MNVPGTLPAAPACQEPMEIFWGLPMCCVCWLASERTALPPSCLFAHAPSCAACGVSPSALGPGGCAGGVLGSRCACRGSCRAVQQLLAICSGARGQRLPGGLAALRGLCQASIYLLNLISYRTVRGFLLQMSENRHVTLLGRLETGKQQDQMPAGGAVLGPGPGGAGPG